MGIFYDDFIPTAFLQESSTPESWYSEDETYCYSPVESHFV